MRTFLCCTLWFLQLTLFTNLSLSSTWHIVGVEEGVKLSKQEFHSHPISANRGELMIQAPISKVATVLNIHSTEFWGQQHPDIARYEISSPTDDQAVHHFKVDLPWPLTDREFVSSVDFRINPENKSILIEFFPTRLQPKKVEGIRGEILSTKIELYAASESETLVIMELRYDQKGLLPHWATQYLQKDWLLAILNNIKQKSSHPEVRHNQSILNLFGVAAISSQRHTSQQ